MPDQATITSYLELLHSHRRTLRQLLKQEALSGEAFVAPAIAHGIADARAEIARLKAELRGWGVEVADEPGDSETPAVQPATRRLANLPPLAWLAIGAGLALLTTIVALLARGPAAAVLPTATPPPAPTTAAPSPAPAATPTGVPTPAPAPDFIARYPLDVAALDLEEFIPEANVLSSQPITDALQVTQLEFGELVGSDLPAWNVRLRFTNTRAEPVVLDLDARFFRLNDDQGRAGDLVYFCCPAQGELLGAGQSREIQLFFRSHPDWFGKEVSARRIFLQVVGLLPIRRATWSFAPLATAS